jgi:hypothetical protein
MACMAGVEIHQRHAWRLRGAGPLRQNVLRIASAGRIFQGFQGWSGRAENDRHAGAARTHDGEVARRIAKSFMLLVRRVVFLIDDDQLELEHRGEHRGARADDDSRLAAVRRTPCIAPFAVGESGVHDRHTRTETAAKAIDELRRQGDFRDQHQRLAFFREGRCDNL